MGGNEDNVVEHIEWAKEGGSKNAAREGTNCKKQCSKKANERRRELGVYIGSKNRWKVQFGGKVNKYIGSYRTLEEANRASIIYCEVLHKTGDADKAQKVAREKTGIK